MGSSTSSGNEKKIFISHSSKNKNIATKLQAYLCKHLSIAETSVFLYENIAPGAKWSQKIQTELHNSSVVVALITKESLSSEPCKVEIYYAWVSSKLVPVLFGYITHNNLEKLFKPLSLVQCTQLNKNDAGLDQALVKLIDGILEKLGETNHIRKGAESSRNALKTSIQDYNNTLRTLSIGDYKLVLEQNGKLVLCEKDSTVLWTPTTEEARVAIMQDDGNFCLYNKAYQESEDRTDKKHSHNCIWASDTWRYPNSPNAYLRLDVNGHLAIVDNTTHNCLKMLHPEGREGSYDPNAAHISLYPKNTMELPPEQ